MLIAYVKYLLPEVALLPNLKGDACLVYVLLLHTFYNSCHSFKTKPLCLFNSLPFCIDFFRLGKRCTRVCGYGDAGIYIYPPWL